MTTLQTPKLTLRLMVESDLKNIHILQSIPEVDKYNTLGIPKDFEETKKVMAPLLANNVKEEIDYYTFIIEQKKDTQFVRLIALVLGSKKFNNAEAWFKLHPNYWGKRYATEALKSVIDFGYQVEITSSNSRLCS